MGGLNSIILVMVFLQEQPLVTVNEQQPKEGQ
jgi:hypothetical protein